MAFPVVEARVAWRPEQFNLVTNPGFETNATGWSVGAGINGAGTSITRITTDDHSGAACGSLVCPATADTGVNFDFGSQTFFDADDHRHAYRFVVWLKAVSGTTQASIIVGSEGTSSDRASKEIALTTEWRPYYVDWLPTGTRTDVQLAIVTAVAQAMTVRIDDVAVYVRDALSQVVNERFLTDTTGWSVGAGINGAGTSITRMASGGYLSATCGRLVTTATTGSGMNFDLGTRLFTSGRTYRLAVMLKRVSGSTSGRLRIGSLGTAGDRGDSTVTVTDDWARYTVDWTPSADRTDVEVAITNGTAATLTVDVDDIEVYEALDDISGDVAAFVAAGSTGSGEPALTFGRGASFDGSSEAAGFATLRVVNDGGKYTPENASSVLHGALSAGRPLWVRATYEGSSSALFYGRVRRFVPNPMEHATSILAQDPLHDVSRIPYQRKATDAWSYETIRRFGFFDSDIISYDLDDDPAIESLAFYSGTERTNLLAYLNQLNQATGTVHFIRPSTSPTRPWDYVTFERTTTSDASATSETWDDDLADLTGYDVTDEAIVNRQRVDITAYRVSEFDYVCAALDPAVYGSDYDGTFHFEATRSAQGLGGTPPPETMPLTIPAGTRRSFTFDFNAPILDPAVATTYTSGSATEHAEISPRRLVLTIEAAGSDAVLEFVGVAGEAALERPINDADRADEESVWLHGEHAGADVGSPYVPHPAFADGLADWHTWRYGAPRARPTVIRHNLFASQLAREVADRISLVFARLSIDEKVFVIRSFQTEVRDNSRSWITTYMLEELPETPAGGWFVLGASALGGDDVLGY